MDLQLTGKTVVITGGATGIGKACAFTYLEEGCNVVVCGRTQSKLDDFAAECRDKGFSNALPLQLDIARADDRDELLAATLSSFGGLNIWINNAGIVSNDPLLDAKLEEFDRILNTNLRATFACSQLAGRYMRDNGGGVIVNASSFAARIPLAGTGIYAASKWGVAALTQAFAAELAPYNIRVFAYIPGIIVSEMTKDRILADREALTQQIALNRLGEASDVAPIIVMLTSDKASYFTGVSVEISGGKLCVQNPRFAWE